MANTAAIAAKRFITKKHPNAAPARMIGTGLWVILSTPGEYGSALNVGAKSVSKAWVYAEGYELELEN